MGRRLPPPQCRRLFDRIGAAGTPELLLDLRATRADIMPQSPRAAPLSRACPILPKVQNRMADVERVEAFTAFQAEGRPRL